MDVGELEKMTSKLNQGKIERLPSNDSLREDQGSRSEISQMEVTFDTYHDSCQEKTIVFTFLCKRAGALTYKPRSAEISVGIVYHPSFEILSFPFEPKRLCFFLPPNRVNRLINW